MSADLLPPTTLEEIFGFEDFAFRQYMRAVSTRALPPQQLEYLAANMLDNEHPIVRSAAGCALAEAALYRHNEIACVPLETRLRNLGLAGMIWSEVTMDFKKMEEEYPLKESNDIFGFWMRSLFARAMLPSLRLAATWISGEAVDAGTTITIIDQTQDRVLALGSTLAWSPPYHCEYTWTRNGLCSELTTTALLQKAGCLVIPGSIRQDHNQKSSVRSDLVVLSSDEGHPRTRVQVSAKPVAFPSEHWPQSTFVVSAYEDLLLDKGVSPIHALRALIEQNESPNPVSEQRLSQMSDNLLQKMTAFNLNRATYSRSKTVDIAREE